LGRLVPVRQTGDVSYRRQGRKDARHIGRSAVRLTRIASVIHPVDKRYVPIPNRKASGRRVDIFRR
jgi:hypothetical protein